MTDDLIKKLPLASTVLLVLSVVYDYFFLQALGLDFSELPTTITDHVRSAIVWLPGFAIASGIGYMLGLSSPPASTNSGIPRSNPHLDFWIFGAVGPTSLLLSFAFEWQYTAWAIATLASIAVFRFQPGRENIEARFGAGSARLLLAIPGAVALVGAAGWKAGSVLLSSPSPTINLELRESSATRQLHVNGLRRFEHATVLVKSGRAVEVIPSSDLLRVRHKAAQSKGVLCQLLGVRCKSDA